MIQKLFHLYPFSRDNKRTYLSAVLIGLFVFFVLLAFQPWGIFEWNTDHKAIKLAGYGMVCTLTILVYRRILDQFVNEENWKVWKEIASIAGLIFVLILVNILYSTAIGALQVNWISISGFALATTLVALFPATISVLINYNRFLHLNQKNAVAINDHLNKDADTDNERSSLQNPGTAQPLEVTFIAENNIDKLTVLATAILYIRSADNYCEIVYLENGICKKELLRSSLKRLEEQHAIPSLIRCHRSYMVNLENVTKAEGNAAGYKLYFGYCDDAVSVSRNYCALVAKRLEQ